MPDQDLRNIANQVAQSNTDRSGIGEQLNTIANSVEDMSKDMRQLVVMLTGQRPMSQANGRTFFNDQYNNSIGRRGRNTDLFGYGGDRISNQWSQSSFKFDRREFERIRKGFMDSFEDAIFEGFFGSTFNDGINRIFNQLALDIGADVKDIPHKLGSTLGKTAMNSFKSSDFGKQLMPALDKFRGKVGEEIASKGGNFLTSLMNGNSLKVASGELAGLGTSLAQAGGELLATIGPIAPQIALAVGVVIGAAKALDVVFDSLALTVNAVKKVYEAGKKAADRENNSRAQNVQLAKTRMEEDYKVLVQRPFELLKEAAETLYSSWNQNLTTVSATQGYDKADVQDLMSAFAQRLREEGLSNYISGSDMFDNLAKVLQSGMSGAIAEEFAYQATVLGKAIPTQDFFSYASTYASVAANAARQGKNQADAIEEANESLQTFANSLLYANRELTGGFTTGLQNASSLYASAAQIAQAAKSDNMSGIASTLLSVQGYIGAIAPDLADQLTSALQKTLTGGNSADIVALRSLAGVNASNTEFLQEFAKNPQKIFGAMFENLANMYSDSNAAYMEKAEGYASLFGLSAEAFQRIDFADLASAIREMNSSSNSLDENMRLLREGQTTTSAEQLKAQQINQYMIEEGLAYVIDNEAAQLIQQHMWDEQMQRELMEATYSVGLTGAAMEALEMIQHAVNNILNFLNPLAYIKKIGNVVATTVEAFAQEADVRQLLEAGKVGNGNAKSLYQLTTRGQDLNLTKSLVELMGGTSFYDIASNGTKTWNQVTSPFYALTDSITQGQSQLTTAIQSIVGFSGSGSGVASQYGWGNISKSRGAAAAALLNATGKYAAPSPDLTSVVTSAGTTAASASASAIKESVDKMLADSYLVDQYVKKGKSYEDWAESASKYGISDLSSALTTAGYTESAIKQYFQDKEVAEGVSEQQTIREEEKTFRDTGVKFWTEDFPNDYRDPLFDKAQTMIDNQATMIENQATMILNQGTMISNQETMITNQEAMIEKLSNIITNQEDWHNYFKNEWAPDWKEYFQSTSKDIIITQGWDGPDHFKEWYTDGEHTWKKFLGDTASLSFFKFTSYFKDFYDKFMDRYVNFTYYRGEGEEVVSDVVDEATGQLKSTIVHGKRSGYTYSDVEKIQQEADEAARGDTVLALAEMLTKNILSLEDPATQTNTLLAQILIVLNAIKSQNDLNNTSTSSISTLAGSISALVMGGTTSTATTSTDTSSII